MTEPLEQFGLGVEDRLKPVFDAAGAKYPPYDLALGAFKDARILELFAREAGQPWQFIRTYPVLSALAGRERV